jgi:hypothetical protein
MCRIEELKDETVRLDSDEEQALVSMLEPDLPRLLEQGVGEVQAPH